MGKCTLPPFPPALAAPPHKMLPSRKLLVTPALLQEDRGWVWVEVMLGTWEWTEWPPHPQGPLHFLQH